jgi:hypothetical protein
MSRHKQESKTSKKILFKTMTHVFVDAVILPGMLAIPLKEFNA